MQLLNAWNPITYLIEAIRALMVRGYEWPSVARALVAIAVLDSAPQAVTSRAFARLARRAAAGSVADPGLVVRALVLVETIRPGDPRAADRRAVP
jgi:hypothetical protein